MAKFNNAARGSFRSLIWLLVLAVALGISAYSLYFVARTLGVPKIFAAGFSTAYDGVALIAADKSLQFAQEGKSGAFPRMVMIIFAGLSSFLNSLHAIFGHESPLAIPIWAGLPIAAVFAFEIHTSQARSKAHARFGYGYPAPVPKFGGWRWSLFPLATLTDLRDVVSARGKAITATNKLAASTSASVHARNASALPAGNGATRSASGNATGSTAPRNGNASRNATEQPAASTARPADAYEASGASGDVTVPSPEDNATEQQADVMPLHGSATGNVTIECWHCHTPFVPIRKTARYCGSNCRTAAHRARTAEAS